MSEPITVAIINYNGKDYLKELIESIKKSNYPELSIILADDCSTDGSVEYIQKEYPDVKCLVMESNKRFKNRYPLANRVRNRALRESDTRLVFLVDNDIVIEPDCIEKLATAMNELEDCSICVPRILYKEEPEIIYSDGTALHYICTSIAYNRNIKLSKEKEYPKYSIGMGIQLIDKAVAEKFDFFHEDFVVGWGDDGELHQRMNIAGYRSYNIPEARVYHPRKDGGFRTVAQVKNRWFFLIENYAARTIFLLLPVLVLYEISLIFFLIIKKEFSNYLISIQDVFKNFKLLRMRRKKAQSRRKLGDGQLMTIGEIFVSSGVLEGSATMKVGLKILEWIFNSYCKVVKVFI